jgi:dolichol-phosphate mannosyltransferase
MKIAVVIPSYKVRNHILDVISRIGSEVNTIYIVDDVCPEFSGKFVENKIKDSRIKIIYNLENIGVGGATIVGYQQALLDKHDIVVKLDGDGQMNPEMIPYLISPIILGKADYIKGNRFYDISFLSSMPPIRIFGNSILSFISKASSGYWNIMDPTNGFTAIHKNALSVLPLEKISKRYFFESEMLFRLNTIRAVVQDIPLIAVYGDEISNLKVSKVALSFPLKYFTCFIKRIFYGYFLRDFNICTLEIIIGMFLMLFGAIYGMINWYWYGQLGIGAPLGTIFVAGLPIILGFQLLLAAITFDVMNIPSIPLQQLLPNEAVIEHRKLVNLR